MGLSRRWARLVSERVPGLLPVVSVGSHVETRRRVRIEWVQRAPAATAATARLSSPAGVAAIGYCRCCCRRCSGIAAPVALRLHAVHLHEHGQERRADGHQQLRRAEARAALGEAPGARGGIQGASEEVANALLEEQGLLAHAWSGGKRWCGRGAMNGGE